MDHCNLKVPASSGNVSATSPWFAVVLGRPECCSKMFLSTSAIMRSVGSPLSVYCSYRIGNSLSLNLKNMHLGLKMELFYNIFLKWAKFINSRGGVRDLITVVGRWKVYTFSMVIVLQIFLTAIYFWRASLPSSPYFISKLLNSRWLVLVFYEF